MPRNIVRMKKMYQKSSKKHMNFIKKLQIYKKNQFTMHFSKT